VLLFVLFILIGIPILDWFFGFFKTDTGQVFKFLWRAALVLFVAVLIIVLLLPYPR
jgi:hypothetical protein